MSKPGSKWSRNELLAYDIHIVTRHPQEFFGTPLPHLGAQLATILNNVQVPPNVTETEASFFSLLRDASEVPAKEESFVDDFAACILRLMGYRGQHCIIHARKEIHFLMCGERTAAKSNVCVLEDTAGRPPYILLVQENKVSTGNLNAWLFLSPNML